MNETERLAEVAALHHERKRKAEELAAIDRQIDLILFPPLRTGWKLSADLQRTARLVFRGYVIGCDGR